MEWNADLREPVCLLYGFIEAPLELEATAFSLLADAPLSPCDVEGKLSAKVRLLSRDALDIESLMYKFLALSVGGDDERGKGDRESRYDAKVAEVDEDEEVAGKEENTLCSKLLLCVASEHPAAVAVAT